jgi:alpha-D-xyloside xylohydrolase
LYSTITFRWDDKAQKLTISDRKGSFPGMLKNRSFTIVKISSADKKEKVVNYTGKSVKINL